MLHRSQSLRSRRGAGRGNPNATSGNVTNTGDALLQTSMRCCPLTRRYSPNFRAQDAVLGDGCLRGEA